MITSMITPMITPMITSMATPTFSGGGAITRYFTLLDSVLKNYWRFANTLELGDSFEFSADMLFDSTNCHIINNQDSGSDRVAIYSGSVYINTTNVGALSDVAFLSDQKMHSVIIARNSTAFTFTVDGIELLSTTNGTLLSINAIGGKIVSTGIPYFDGIISNAKVTISGSTQTFTLGNSYEQGATETSAEGGNSITRFLVPATKIEQYQLSNDGTQWDNISPVPQELPAIIEIAQ